LKASARGPETVTYTVAVNEVKERVLPELDDDWVDENTEFETVAEFRHALREQLGEAKLRSATREFADRALSTLRDQVDVELPESLVRAEMDSNLHNFLHRLEEAEVTLDDYFQATGITREAFIGDLEAQAEGLHPQPPGPRGDNRGRGFGCDRGRPLQAIQSLAARSGTRSPISRRSARPAKNWPWPVISSETGRWT
jgi:hypothetical protein